MVNIVKVIGIFLTLGLGVTGQIEAVSYKIEGSIGSNKERLELEVTIAQISENQLYIDNQTNQTSQLEVYVVDTDQSRPVMYRSSDEREDRNKHYYWEIQSVKQTQVSKEYQLIYRVFVYNNKAYPDQKSILSILDGKDKTNQNIEVAVRFVPKDENSSEEKSSNVKIWYDLSVPTDAPMSVSARAVHKGIQVKWQGAKSVNYSRNLDQQIKSKVPTRVLAMLFKPGNGNISLNAMEVVNEKLRDDSSERLCPEGEDMCYLPFNGCTFTDPSGCVVCENSEGKNIFITKDQDFASDVGIFTLHNNEEEQASVSLLDLDPVEEGSEEQYALVLQYEKGTKRTSCITDINPILTWSLTEINGEKDGEAETPSCFIATVSFGSPMHRYVATLRWFRNHYLLPFSFGRKLIKVYYRYGKLAADWISDKPHMKSAARFFLIPIIWLVQLLQKGFDGVLVVLLGLLTAGLLFYREKKRSFTR